MKRPKMKKIQKAVVLTIALTSIVLVSSVCRSQPAAQPAPAAPAAAAPAAPAAAPAATPAAAAAPGAAPTAGTGPATIKVKVVYTGANAAAPQRLKSEAFPECGTAPIFDETLVVKGGALANALVQVKGVPGAATPPAGPVTLDQKGCQYHPHVVAGVMGQKIQIINSDPGLHNIHAYAGTATIFNQAMFKGMKPIEKICEKDQMTVKCDVHPFMRASVYCLNHPYFGVTGETGEVAIANVPAGTYTLTANHEQLGEKTQSVTVAAGQTAQVTISYP